MRYKKRQKQIEIDRKRNKKTERNYLKRQKEIERDKTKYYSFHNCKSSSV